MIKILANKGIIIIVLLVLLVLSGVFIKSLLTDHHRQRENYEILVGAKETELTLTKSELSKMISADQELRRVIKDSLKLRDRQIVALKRANANQTIRWVTTLQDSIIYVEVFGQPIATADTVQVFHYVDRWYSVHGSIIADSTISAVVKSTDDLFITTYRFKPGTWFLPRLFQKSQIRTEIVNSNPSAYYTITKELKVIK
jgi:hypothetical protein